MSRKRRSSSRKPPASPPIPQASKTPVLYIIIVSVMVFSLVIAGLASVDWGALFPASVEPTPDYSIDPADELRQTAEASPDDAEAQVRLASMLANTGRMQEAIPVFEEAIRLDPENSENRRLFAESLQKSGMPADAEAQFLTVIELNPDDHRAHYYLAQLYMDWQPRRQEEAVVHYERVIEIAPNSFYAERSIVVLESLGPATPASYEVTPIGSPTYAD